ncbi:MAG: L-histidine N(alpha)-methyltransferase [Bdellovibrionota bacterium]|nr:L-histidine N(alpha)-methyltransferase [Pseudobdellovibrionaceae bacterium]
MEISNLDKNQNKLSMNEQFALDVLMGLCSSPKTISPKYFYDDKGSELFQKITQHKDYYLTRTEFEILSNNKNELANLIEDDEIDVIELGAGDGHKSQIILNSLLEADKVVNYYPIDISEEAMKQLDRTISSHKYLKIHGIVSEYMAGLRFLRNKSKNKQLVLFLGSNIGNFDKVHCQVFLRELWNNLDNNDLALIGFDLKKDVNVLTNAYNDAAGYTRDFNLNLLDRINKVLGADFDPSKFQHFGVYNPRLGAMESYLISKEEQEVYIKEIGRAFHFKSYEALHLEYSFKYIESDIRNLCDQTGFVIEKNFTDENSYFVDSLWRVDKN